MDTGYNIDELGKHHVKLKKQTQEITYWMISFIQNVQNRQIHRDRK